MQGYLFKKKERRWKQQYFVLKQDGADSHLYFYDHPKRTKPKGLIDLSCAYMYTVHESFFDKRFCFQVINDFNSPGNMLLQSETDCFVANFLIILKTHFVRLI